MKTKRNLWPMGIILTFVLFISGTISLVVLACSQKLDLVSADYYEQEIKFQNRVDQLDRAGRLATQASVAYEQATHRIRISLPPDTSGQIATGSIHLYRPSAAGLDRHLTLEVDSRGVQFLDAATLRSGLWKVRVSWKVEKQEYFLDQSIVIGPGTHSA
jgi:nitrogen fixation protein FixH